MSRGFGSLIAVLLGIGCGGSSISRGESGGGSSSGGHSSSGESSGGSTSIAGSIGHAGSGGAGVAGMVGIGGAIDGGGTSAGGAVQVGGSGSVGGMIAVGGSGGVGGSGISFGGRGGVGGGGGSGGGHVDSHCPARPPSGTCTFFEGSCQYDVASGCLCYWSSNAYTPCNKVDPSCPSSAGTGALPAPGGASGSSAGAPIPPTQQNCGCSAGNWYCELRH